MNMDESSQPAGIRSKVAASILPPTSAAGPRERAGLAVGRGTAEATSLKGVAMQSSSVQNSADTPGGGATSTPSAVF